ncbi:MAG: hypothetical protein HGN29_01635 [Asgard group archaeon]|nr:hypothetical protein [Asgard group archaeon]
MTWIPLLLGDKSPSLRLLVLRELLHKDENDDEVQELLKLQKQDSLITDLLKFQQNDGSWLTSESLGLTMANPILNTTQALCRLGYLGFDKSHPAIEKAANFLFSFQLDTGSWPGVTNASMALWMKETTKKSTEPYFEHPHHGKVIAPSLTGFPLRALAMCGYATDPRAEKAYDYLLTLLSPDGSWPYMISPDGDIAYQVVGYRKMPNSRYGCRTNTSIVLNSFAYHPKRRKSEQTKKALDLLLARETRERQHLGYETARMIGAESSHGFLTYYARFDVAMVLDLCWKIGATKEDPRVADLIEYFIETQGVYGLWEYESKPQASRWVTFDILKSLSRIDEAGEWVTTQPRTRYESYPKKPQRH